MFQQRNYSETDFVSFQFQITNDQCDISKLLWKTINKINRTQHEKHSNLSTVIDERSIATREFSIAIGFMMSGKPRGRAGPSTAISSSLAAVDNVTFLVYMQSKTTVSVTIVICLFVCFGRLVLPLNVVLARHSPQLPSIETFYLSFCRRNEWTHSNLIDPRSYPRRIYSTVKKILLTSTSEQLHRFQIAR